MDRRNTLQKEIVRNAVSKLGNHATADEIYLCVNAEYPTISRGTVYRNLGILTEEGKIRRIEVPSSADRYDHMCSDHCHVVCVKCGRVFDCDTFGCTDLLKHIRDTHGFEFIGYSVIFKGICPDCSKKEEK